jgi:hypothetical protein
MDRGLGDGVKIAFFVLLSTVAVGQDDRIKIFILVSSHPDNSVITQLGNVLGKEFIASRKYRLVPSQGEADVQIAVIGVGPESHEYAAASALVCLRPSSTNSALYHTISLVGANRTNTLAHTWFLDSDKQIQSYLHQ